MPAFLCDAAQMVRPVKIAGPGPAALSSLDSDGRLAL